VFSLLFMELHCRLLLLVFIIYPRTFNILQESKSPWATFCRLTYSMSLALSKLSDSSKIHGETEDKRHK